MRIYHNIPALNAWRNSTMINTQMGKSLERLSTGLRINRAADDAAGLAISEKMRAQVRGLSQAMRNAQDGISLIQTAEGGLNETHSILQRMRELSVQAANDTYTSEDRSEIQKEIDQLVSEVDRIAATTQFNKKQILNGDLSALVSSDKLTTRIYMRDGLRVLDQFGQKEPGGGNYKLEITADPGKNQVQKTDIFKVKHGGVGSITDEEIGNGRFAAAHFAIAAANDATDGVSVRFDFTVGATNFSVRVGATDGDDGATLAGLLNADSDFSNHFCARGDETNLCIVALCANTDFEYRATLCVGTIGAFEIGTATADGNTTGIISTYEAGKNPVACTTGDINSDVASASRNVTNVALSDTNHLLEGNYNISTNITPTGDADATSNIVAQYAQNTALAGSLSLCAFTVAAASPSSSILFEITALHGDCTATLKYQYHEMAADGTVTSGEGTRTIALCAGQVGDIVIGGVTFAAANFRIDNSTADLTIGDKFLIDVTGQTASSTGSDLLTVCGDINGSGTVQATFVAQCGYFDGQTRELRFFQLNGDNTSCDYGKTADAQMDVTFGRFMTTESNAWSGYVTPGLEVGSIATANTRLYDVDRFWDASGNFILETPKTLTLVQGDGKQATITVSGADTFADIQTKLNDAIANGLGQGALSSVNQDTDKFVSFVETPTASGFEALQGTFVIRSAIAGKEGEITFVGDDATIAALSLTTIQQSVNNNFTVTVKEIHSGDIVACDVKIATNLLEGVVHRNVDVEFASYTGVEVTWDADTKNWRFEGGETNKGETFVHLADRTMVLHIGANQKQDIGTGIGNMGKFALGIQNIQVTSNELANKAIGTIDRAIGMVSSERSKLGALQNRLEHTINNLGVTMENLTAAESRIRDADMAWEIMNFTKQQILLQSANAMLAQANQLPQNVLQLLR